MAISLDAYLTLYKDKWWFIALLVLLVAVSTVATHYLMRMFLAERYQIWATLGIFMLIAVISVILMRFMYLGTGFFITIGLLMLPVITTIIMAIVRKRKG